MSCVLAFYGVKQVKNKQPKENLHTVFSFMSDHLTKVMFERLHQKQTDLLSWLSFCYQIQISLQDPSTRRPPISTA